MPAAAVLLLDPDDYREAQFLPGVPPAGVLLNTFFWSKEKRTPSRRCRSKIRPASWNPGPRARRPTVPWTKASVGANTGECVGGHRRARRSPPRPGRGKRGSDRGPTDAAGQPSRQQTLLVTHTFDCSGNIRTCLVAVTVTNQDWNCRHTNRAT